ncbi:hypothetical protein M758_UG003200 [Ceratodon purpureus]|nr:hypothetical protein M758_UG003200 [Ceratodon purpureus]
MRFEGLLLHEAALLAAPDTCDQEAGRAYYYTTKILLTSQSHVCWETPSRSGSQTHTLGVSRLRRMTPGDLRHDLLLSGEANLSSKRSYPQASFKPAFGAYLRKSDFAGSISFHCPCC